MAGMPLQFLLSFCVLWVGSSSELLSIPDDVQAFVQHSTRPSLATEDIPKSKWPICTAKELADYNDEVAKIERERADAIAETQKELQVEAEAKETGSNGVQEALMETLWHMVKRTSGEAATELLPVVMKVKGQQPATFNSTAFKKKVKEIWSDKDEWMKALKRAAKLVDEEISTKMNLSPVLAAKLSPLGSSLTKLGSFMLRKLLPITAVKRHPKKASQIASFVSQLPEKPEEVRTFLMAEVLPTLIRKPDDLKTAAAPAPAPMVIHAMPKRTCQTCAERYRRVLYGPDDENTVSCSARCSTVLFSCIAGITGDCMMKMDRCFSCHLSAGAQNSNCTGVEASAVEKLSDDKLIRMVTAIRSGNLTESKRWEWIPESLADEVFQTMFFT